MKPKIYYDRETDILSIWNGIPASEAEDVAEHLVADFNEKGEVVGFTMECASELLGVVPSIPNNSDRRPSGKSASRLFGMLKYEGPFVSLEEMDDSIVSGACESDVGTEQMQQAFNDLLQCHENIRNEFSRIDDSVLAEFLGEYDTKRLRQQVRKYGDGYTLRSIPKDIDSILGIDVLVILVMNSPKLGKDSEFNPFTPKHLIPYWRDGKGLQPYTVVNGRKCKLRFISWEQKYSVHGKTDPDARKNQNLLQRHYPMLSNYLQEERQASERFILQYIGWLVTQKKQVVVLTNYRKKSFDQPISQLLTASHIIHIPTKLFGPNRRIMGYISKAIRKS